MSFSGAPKRQIYAFCESVNQIAIADAAAKSWADWADVIGVSFVHTFRLDPNAIAAAANLADFIMLDRNRTASFKEADICEAMNDWLLAVGQEGVCVLSFNDGSRLARVFVETARRCGLQRFVIQDGFLGHETNFEKPSFRHFQKQHAALLTGQADLTEAIADEDMQKLYALSCATTKIGAARDCIYFVRGLDVKIKMCVRYTLRPEQVRILGSVHSALDKKPGRRRKRAKNDPSQILYVGQCHTRHGKIDVPTWLDTLKVTFDALEKVEAKVRYKFHPSEAPEIREAIRRMIPADIEIVADGILTASDYAKYDVVLAETSSSLLEAVNAGTKVIVHDVPALSERLPRIADENVRTATTKNLADVLSNLDDWTEKQGDGSPLSLIEGETAGGFFDHIGRTIYQSVCPTPQVLRQRKPVSERAVELASVASRLSLDYAKDCKDGGEYFALLRNKEVLIEHLRQSPLKRYIPVLRKVFGEKWIEEFSRELPVYAKSFKEPELALLGEMLAGKNVSLREEVISVVSDNRLVDYLSMTIAAFAEDLSFEQRLNLLEYPHLLSCTDAQQHLTKIVLSECDDRPIEDVLHDVFAMLHADDRLEIAQALELILSCAISTGISYALATVKLLSLDIERPYFHAVQSIHRILEVIPTEFDTEELLNAINIAALKIETKTHPMVDTIAYACKLAEGLYSLPDKQLHSIQASKSIIDSLGKRYPFSARTKRARAIIFTKPFSRSNTIRSVAS